MNDSGGSKCYFKININYKIVIQYVLQIVANTGFMIIYIEIFRRNNSRFQDFSSLTQLMLTKTRCFIYILVDKKLEKIKLISNIDLLH